MGKVADLLKQQADAMEKRHQESYQRKDDKPSSFGTIFLSDKIPKGVEKWNPDKGEHEIDILMWPTGSQHPHDTPKGVKASFKIDLWVYMNVGPQNKRFVSPSIMWNQPDPIQEYIAAKRLSKKEYGRRQHKSRVIFLVWVHDTKEEEDKGPQLWDVAAYYMGEPLDHAAMLPHGGGHVPFSNYRAGIGKRLWFEKKKGGTWEDDEGADREGIIFSAPKFIDRKEDIPDWVLERTFPVDECINMHPSYEEIYEALHQKKYQNPDSVSTPSDPTSTTVAPDVEGCPHEHEFGVDINEYPECRSCPKWDACQAKQLELKLEKEDVKQEEEMSQTETKMTNVSEETVPETPKTTTKKRSRTRSRTRK